MRGILLLITLVSSTFLMAQEKGTITGMVLDQELGNEPLPFTTVSVIGSDVSTTSDLDGLIKLELTAGTYQLSFNFPGYKKAILKAVVVKENQVTKLSNISLKALASPQLPTVASEANGERPRP